MPDPSHRPLTLPELERWVAFGGTWQPVLLTEEQAVVDLCRCTGEREERRESLDAEVIRYLRANPQSAD